MAPGDVSDLVCMGRTMCITLIGVVDPYLHFVLKKQGSNPLCAAVAAAATSQLLLSAVCPS